MGFSAIESIKCTSILVLCICLKKSWPKPTPSAAPDINPGISAKRQPFPSTFLTTPKLGIKVVKG